MLRIRKMPKIEDNNKIMKDVDNEYSNYLRFIDRQHNSYKHVKRNINPPRKIFDLLFGWELKLRKILEERGLLMKKGDSAYGAMI